MSEVITGRPVLFYCKAVGGFRLSIWQVLYSGFEKTIGIHPAVPVLLDHAISRREMQIKMAYQHKASTIGLRVDYIDHTYSAT